VRTIAYVAEEEDEDEAEDEEEDEDEDDHPWIRRGSRRGFVLDHFVDSSWITSWIRRVISMYFPPTKSKTKVHKNYYYYYY
jgi:hypothetical protein